MRNNIQQLRNIQVYTQFYFMRKNSGDVQD